jgi:protein-disulfide isomerase
MSNKAVSVEFFFAGGCENCVKAREALRKAAESNAGVVWKETDIGKSPHQAVDMGVVSTPAIAIDGRLVFKSAPSPAELKSAIQALAGKG